MPRLVIRKGQGVGRDVALGGECIVGRHPQVTFVIDDTQASRRHLRVFQQGYVWFVEDLGSTNGTSVNGGRLEASKKRRLQDGDVIGVGGTEIEFVQKGLVDARPAAKVERAVVPPVLVPPMAKPATPPVAPRVVPAAPTAAPAAPVAPTAPAAPKVEPAPAPATRPVVPAPVPTRRRR
jgi:pSer/pThr/pTyr-binding forkhead associated (FHA) protein